MPKIYLVGSESISEVELIKKTAEQLHIDRKSLVTVWKAGNYSSNYYASRLNRHRVDWFETLPEAVEHMKEQIKQSMEASVNRLNKLQLQLAALAAFQDEIKEQKDGS